MANTDLNLGNDATAANNLKLRADGAGGGSIRNGAGTVLFSFNANGVILPVQAATASAPAYVKGGIYFDTTLNKMRIGGATAWETVTSV